MSSHVRRTAPVATSAVGSGAKRDRRKAQTGEPMSSADRCDLGRGHESDQRRTAEPTVQTGGVMRVGPEQARAAARAAGGEHAEDRAFIEQGEVEGHRQILAFGVAVHDLKTDGTASGDAAGHQEAASDRIDRRDRPDQVVAAAER